MAIFNQDAGRGKTSLQLGWNMSQAGAGEEEFQGSM